MTTRRTIHNLTAYEAAYLGMRRFAIGASLASMHAAGAITVDSQNLIRVADELPPDAPELDRAIHTHLSQNQPVDLIALGADPDVRAAIENIDAGLAAVGVTTVWRRFRILRRLPVLILAGPTAIVAAGLWQGLIGALVCAVAVLGLAAIAITHALRLWAHQARMRGRLIRMNPQLEPEPGLRWGHDSATAALAVGLHDIDALRIGDPPLARAMGDYLGD